jgi:hypothetical protein
MCWPNENPSTTTPARGAGIEGLDRVEILDHIVRTQVFGNWFYRRNSAARKNYALHLIPATSHSDANITTAKIGDAQILEAKIADAQITNAKIVSLDAVKITTGDLLVGGSGKIGQVTVYDGSNTAFGWIGKNGSDYGAWFAQLRAGGSGWSTARLKVASGGAVSLDMIDGDAFTLTSSSNTMEVFINNAGLMARNSATPGNRSQMLPVGFFIDNTSGGGFQVTADSAGIYLICQDLSGNQIAMESTTANGERLRWTAGPTVTAGSGTPEGVVTAHPGSLFLRVDGGAGTCLYVKQSGSGNTGWAGK